jgi:hypothetical protein
MGARHARRMPREQPEPGRAAGAERVRLYSCGNETSRKTLAPGIAFAPPKVDGIVAGRGEQTRPGWDIPFSQVEEAAMRSFLLSAVLGVSSLGFLGALPSAAEAGPLRWWRDGYYSTYYYPPTTTYYSAPVETTATYGPTWTSSYYTPSPSATVTYTTPATTYYYPTYYRSYYYPRRVFWSSYSPVYYYP